jgi:hypothetical protein
MKHYHRWQWISRNGERLSSVGINPDGTLWNPNGYPEDVVRAAVLWADELKCARLKEGAQKAAKTRKRRHEIKLQAIVKKLLRDENIGPSTHCVLCKKELSDPQSLARGIGS